MPYALFEKKKRRGRKHRVTITKNGAFIINSASVRDFLQDFSLVHVLIEKDVEGKTIKIAFHPMKKEDENTYHLTRRGKASAAVVSARGVIEEIGYKNEKTQPFDARWEERFVKGRKEHVLEIEVDPKYCQQK